MKRKAEIARVKLEEKQGGGDEILSYTFKETLRKKTSLEINHFT